MAKKKILLLSDDLRLASGVGTMSRQLVLGTVDKYDWVQVGAAINHPEAGKIYDLSQDARNRTGVADASVKLYPSNGYGNPDMIRQILMVDRPDAILHFTDPRYWIWLYEMEHEIRQSVPIFFYAIWDDLPDPLYNHDYYSSCDWIGCISKQTYGIVKRVWGWDKEKHWSKPQDWQVSYVPHGIDSDTFKPSTVPQTFYTEIFGNKKYDYVVYWNNRNIRRKQPVDVMLAFEEFRKSLPKDKRDSVCLLMHTQPVDENGTDLPRTKDHLLPEANVIFLPDRHDDEKMNWLYNIADVTVNIASNEGFGLATAESVMAGTPIIVLVTGGLQDQCGFKDKETGKFLTHDDYLKIGSLHKRSWQDKVTWGEWVEPIWPVRSVNGSVPTPYIFDDRVDFEDVTPLIRKFYDMSREERKEKGLKGRAWMLSDGNLSHKYMCSSLIDGMETAFENWKPREKYQIVKI